MFVSRICLVLAGIAVIVGLAASPALAAPLADEGQLTGGQISTVDTVAAADSSGQGWFGR